ncbi:MAG: aconitase X [Candidatus Jordarchaeaceae archaeon]
MLIQVEASGFTPPDEKIGVGIHELNDVKEKLSTIGDKTSDIVALGCPHCSVEELKRVAFFIKEKELRRMPKWIFTSSLARILAHFMG